MAYADREQELEQKISAAERELDDMERRSEALDQRVQDVKSDWRAKREDPAFPGATPPADEAQNPTSASANDVEDDGEGVPGGTERDHAKPRRQVPTDGGGE